MQFRLNRIKNTIHLSSILIRYSFCCIFPFLYFSVSAQIKLSFDDAYQGDESLLKAALPAFAGWERTEVLKMKKNGKLISVNPFTKSVTESTEEEKRSNPMPPLPANSELLTESNSNYSSFVEKNNIVIRYYHEGLPLYKQITNDGNDSLLNGKASYVYQEEITGLNTMKWDHTGNYMAFMRSDEANVPVYSLYIPEGQHGHLENYRYPQAGNTNPKVRVGIYSVEKESLIWADFPPDDDQIFGRLSFTPDSKLLVRWMNRGQDLLRVYEVDPDTGKKKLLYEEHQKTWIDINYAAGFEYIDNGQNIVIFSDRSGHSHYYLHRKDGSFVNQITSGEYDVCDFLGIDEKARRMYFTARKENTARYDIYSIKLDGSNLRRISKGDYTYTKIHLSPDKNFFVANYSNTHTIETSAVFDIEGNKIIELGNARGSKFNQYILPKRSFIRVKSTDGLFDLPVVITYPLNFDSTRQYPVLMTVYGGPAAGKVFDEWSISLPEIYWAQQGIIQVIADNRSSGHFGKKGMDYIHRQVGIIEIEDFMAVGRWLKQQPWVNPSKLCITGFSHGGYMTCLGLTYGADVFDYGIDYYGNTDPMLYDTHYTERYMDSPEENPEGYKRSAVKTYLHKYKGMLRIIHGYSDNNVHPQHSLDIAGRLQEMGKHFEFILYPGVRHGFRGKKWLHSKQELEIFINKYLLTP